MNTIERNKTQWICMEDGSFTLRIAQRAVLKAGAAARHTDGRTISTRDALLCGTEILEKEGGSDPAELSGVEMRVRYRAQNGLVLTERLGVTSEGMPWAGCILSGEEGGQVETSSLSPLIFCRPQEEPVPEIWKSLWTKMLLVPYDNTMWLRYEAVPLRPGRQSYDMTVLFSEKSREGLLVGAADFDVWKNGILCSGSDANVLEARSGVADEGTHDSCAHGRISGENAESSRFFILYGTDYRNLLERYGDAVANLQPKNVWNEGVPFGWNSWAGLAFKLDGEHYRSTCRFMKDVLVPGSFSNEGRAYVNLDSGWDAIPEKQLEKQVEWLHENGLKAGIYDCPFAFFGRDPQQEIPGAPGRRFEEILLCDEEGRPLPRVDGAIPMDVTHPVWKRQMKWKLERFLAWGFDYVKLDFLSHGGMEGAHADKAVHTGRQAIRLGYGFIQALLAPENAGRPFFISMSIAPLFPSGFGHARRFSCDAFGTAEDVEYVLNAQTWAWWESGRLYQYNDPDHICLLKSFCSERDSLEGEARARYTVAVIAGTVMMLSDDYGTGEEGSADGAKARRRTQMFSGNREINALAAKGIAFRPAEAAGTSASAAYTALIDGKTYLALFHWNEGVEEVTVLCERAGLPESLALRELWGGRESLSEDGKIVWTAKGCDAALFECTPL